MFPIFSQWLVLALASVWPVPTYAYPCIGLDIRSPCTQWRERFTLADVAESLAARRSLKLQEHAAQSDECAEEQGLLEKLATWSNVEQMPEWTTSAEFVALIGGGPLVTEDSEEADEEQYDFLGFYDEGGSIKVALGFLTSPNSPWKLKWKSKVLKSLEKPLVDLRPPLPVTTVKFNHTFWEYIGHLSVKLISDFGEYPPVAWMDEANFRFGSGVVNPPEFYYPPTKSPLRYFFPLECVFPSMEVDANDQPKDCLAAFLNLNFQKLWDRPSPFEDRQNGNAFIF